MCGLGSWDSSIRENLLFLFLAHLKKKEHEVEWQEDVEKWEELREEKNMIKVYYIKF